MGQGITLRPCLVHIFFFFFFFMNGNTEQAQCALSLVCIPQEMGEKGSKKNKKVYKIFKKCNKKIIPSGP